jgi:hypothetical protein
MFRKNKLKIYSVAFTPCQPNPCLNGGQCIPNGLGFLCQCPSNYAGNRCEAPGKHSCFEKINLKFIS